MVLAPTLLLNAGSGAIARPTFSRDFAGEKTLNNGTGPAIAFTRGSHATYFDASGTLRFAPNNAIRNSQAGGAVVGAPGTMPTNWTAGVVPGITAEVVATNSTGGLNYVDVKYSGTNSSGSAVFPGILFESATQVVASASQTWTGSFYAAIVAGGATGISSIRADVYENTAAGVFVTNSNTVITLGSTLARYSHTRTLTDATTARVNGRLFLVVDGSATINITLRIAAPQLERGSTATDYNPTTGTAFFGPRFDHDPATGASRGLLIEESRQNLLQRSAEFDNAYWTKTRASITANAIAAPDGTTTADLLVEDNSASNSHFAFRQIAHAGANGPVTATVFAKAKERTRVSLVVGAGTPSPVNFSFGETVFNLADGTAGSYIAFQAGTASNGTGSATIVNVGNGWYRCSVTVTPVGVTATDTQLYIALHNGTSTSYTGDNTSGAYIWGAQLEAGDFPTSYIPTTSAAVTRQADSAIVNPISSFYNQSEGTLFAEASNFGDGVNTTSVAFTEDNNTNERFQLRVRGGGLSVVAAGAISAGTSNIPPATNVASKKAGAAKLNDFAISTSGAAAETDPAGNMPNVTHLVVGALAVTLAQPLNGHIRKIAYWPRRLSNALLQQLTT